ncbi:MAG TPA: peptide chain release factor N(5)-glutamine methyltransferase [Candidatus Sulfotelmatobacter sp.]|nr:peptide chain release factor N(5)-glutamine methyltransferase [Candidatus Sulfotelmatobacter sp.]
MDARTAFKTGIARLRDADVASFTLAAELLLLHVVGRDRTWFYAHPEDEISAEQEERFLSLIARRAAGEPTQYLTGTQEFWGLEFEVTPDVLIPRPETEHVIEIALDRLALREIRAGRKQTLSGEGLRIADVGTGSGCIVAALAKDLPDARILGTDISSAALNVARRNAARLGFGDRIEFIESNLLDKISPAPRFHLIVSNPPYIGRNEAPTLAREVRDHEPATALFGGEEGYELYADLITQSAEYLEPGGILVLELGHNSLPAVQPLFETQDWTHVGVANDLAGIPRVIAAERA